MAAILLINQADPSKAYCTRSTSLTC